MDQLDALNEEILWCTKSFKEEPAKNKRVLLGWGSRTPFIVFVGEAPRLNVDGPGTVFVTGPDAPVFQELLNYLELHSMPVYVTNAIKCTLPYKMLGSDVLCKPWLMEELRILGPRVVVALGRTAAQSLFLRNYEIIERTNSEVPVGRFKVTAYYAGPHPGTVKYGSYTLETYLARFLLVKDWIQNYVKKTAL